MNFLVFVAVFAICARADLNDSPIVAVLDLETVSEYGWSYIAAGYVKWAESGGMRVVPLLFAIE